MSFVKSLAGAAAAGALALSFVGVANAQYGTGINTTTFDYGTYSGSGVWNDAGADATLDGGHADQGTAQSVVGHPAWAAPLGGTSWISAYKSGTGPENFGGGHLTADFEYSVAFTTASVSNGVEGSFLSDDGAYNIGLFNSGGTLLGLAGADGSTYQASPAAYTSPMNFSINLGLNGLAAGNYTLRFWVSDGPGIVTGLDTKFGTIAPIPEPGAVAFAAIMGGGVLGLIGRARVRSRK